VVTVPVEARGPVDPNGHDGELAPGPSGPPHGPVLAVTASVVVVVTLATVPRTGAFFAAHTAGSPTAAVADAAAGLALAGLALVAWLLRPGRRDLVPAAAAVAALAWIAPAWIAWTGAGPLLRSSAMLVEPLLLAALLHLLLTTVPASDPRPGRAVETAVAALLVTVAIGRALVRDPFLDPFCWGNCRTNVLLVVSVPPVARALDTVWVVTTFAVGAVIAGVAVRQLARGGPRTRRLLGPVLGPAVLVGVSYVAYGAALFVARPERGTGPLFASLFQARAWSVALFASGVAGLVVRSWRARHRLSGLAAELEDAPAAGTLDRVLAQATRDADLVVLYPSPTDGRYTDAAGVPTPMPPSESLRAVTSIVSGGEEIAVVVHDRAAVGAEDLRRAFGPALRLALANERLQAELLAHLHRLRRSRARAVELGDQERRRLERNLHDGAQQQVLTLAIGLQVTRIRAEAAEGDELGEILRSAEREAVVAVAELRELAHGIYPAVLSESGLEAALRDLADRASLPVEIEAVPQGRLSELAERVAYHSAAEAVRSAEVADGEVVRVSARVVADHLELEIVGAGHGRLVAVEDRVDAAGGQVLRSGRTLRVELPCA
jgi:signal transduction histidine kinase